MTAREQLRDTIEELSEAEAADTLEFLARRRGGTRDALTKLLDRAPVDAEPTTSEEDHGVRDALEQISRGETFTAGEIRREIA